MLGKLLDKLIAIKIYKLNFKSVITAANYNSFINLYPVFMKIVLLEMYILFIALQLVTKIQT
jgi:hypothetical protein